MDLTSAPPPPLSGGGEGGHGLGAHIRGWMLTVGLVPLVVLFAYGYYAARGALVEAVDDQLLSVAAARRAQIESWLRERTTDLEVISRSQDCIALVEQAASHAHHASVCQYLDSFQTGSRDYQVLALYDLDWNWVASQSGSESHREALVDQELREALANRPGPVMSAVHPHQDLAIGLHAANRLRQAGGEPVGYVVASLDLTGTFAPILEERAGLGRTGRVLLAAADGEVLLTGAGKPSPGETLPPAVVETVRRGNSGTMHFRRPESGSVFGGFAVVPERGWIIVAEMQESEALALLHSLQRGFLVAGLVTLGGVILLSSRTSRRLSAPLAELAAAARRIKAGNQHERVPVLGGREVAEVGRAFNEMTDALEEIQRQKIQAGTLAAIGELSSNMVHEIRNRLSSVKMNVQALEKHVRENPTYGELARIALEQVRRTEETLTELLNYARPLEPVYDEIEPGPLLHELLAEFRAEAAARGIEVGVEDGASGRRLRGDRRLLAQALGNLLRNAFEAIPDHGHVRLGIAGGAGGRLRIEVEDDGPGFGAIPPGELFKPFFSTRERGTGLGLALVKKIAENHGGCVDAESTPGRTIFRIELPALERCA